MTTVITLVGRVGVGKMKPINNTVSWHCLSLCIIQKWMSEVSVTWIIILITIDRHFPITNKANLRDLIAATGLVILLKLDWSRRFFSPCDLEIWWITSKNDRATLLHYIRLCASSQTPPWIETGVTVWKRSIRVKIGDFCSVWPWN